MTEPATPAGTSPRSRPGEGSGRAGPSDGVPPGIPSDGVRWSDEVLGPRPTTLDGARALAYAQATNDANPAYLTGDAVPPVFGVVATWEVLWGLVRVLVAPGLHDRILHAAHDLHLHRPLRPGQELWTTGRAYGLRRTRSGTRVTAHLRSVDAGGDAVLEQYATLFLRRVTGPDDRGEDPPDHALPPGPPGPGAPWRAHLDADQTVRYRDASGDLNPIHTDHEAARAAGLPGIVVHGLCTMALCGAAVVELHADGDPARLARLAVAFSWPVFPGNDLEVATRSAGSGTGEVGFTADSAGKTVIRDGRARLRPPAGPPPAGGA